MEINYLIKQLPKEIKTNIFKYMRHPLAYLIHDCIMNYEKWKVFIGPVLARLCDTGRLDPRYIKKNTFTIYCLECYVCYDLSVYDE